MAKVKFWTRRHPASALRLHIHPTCRNPVLLHFIIWESTMRPFFKLALPAAGCLALFAATPALAQPCASNFKVDGVPMVTGLSYRTWDLIANRQPAAVLQDLGAAVSAEGFADMRIDRATNAVVAIQETTGSGRPQTLRITARKNGKGTRIDAVFVVQAGQIAPEDYVRKAFCRVIGGARRG
jgi:hypothetical protein